MKIRRILTKLNQLIRALDEGDYWMDQNDQTERETEIEDWCGNDENDWFVDEAPPKLCILEICGDCGRTVQKTCENCS